MELTRFETFGFGFFIHPSAVQAGVEWTIDPVLKVMEWHVMMVLYVVTVFDHVHPPINSRCVSPIMHLVVSLGTISRYPSCMI